MTAKELKIIVTASKATVDAYAKALGLSRSTLNRYLNGSTTIRNILVPAIQQVAEEFRKNPPKYRLHQMAPRRRRMK